MTKKLVLVLVVGALTACEALPKVGYDVVSSPPDEAREITSYALQETLVTITADKDKNLTVETGRTEHQGSRVLLLDKTSWGVDADIGIVKFENTDIPSEITVKVTDSRKELIEKVGAAAVKIIGIAAAAFSGADEITPPIALLNLSALLTGEEADQRNTTFNDNKHAIDVEYSPVPADAIPVSSLNAKEPAPYFYYAACRSATLTYKYDGKPYTSVVKVSDPRYLQRVRLPYDGKVTMHSQCGASVTGNLKGADGSEVALIQALIEQADAVKQALDKKDEE